MLLFLLVIAVAQAKTVRYSNIPPRAAIATKTYDLEVPGSAPIRIIEAEPLWGPEVITTQAPPENGSKKKKTGKEFVTTTESSQFTLSEPQRSKNFSLEALNTFLKDYADKVNENKKKNANRATTTEEPINKLASIYLQNDRMDDDKLKSWGSIDTKRQKYPFEDKKGWVTLEAIPWSTSKISKWQSNHKTEPKPWESHSNRPQSNWNTKYSNYDKNPFLESSDTNVEDNYNEPSNSEYENYNSNENIFHDKPVAHYDVDIRPPSSGFSRPQKPKPAYTIDVKPIKVKPDAVEWIGEVPSKPAWNSRPVQQNHWNNPPNSWVDRNSSPTFLYSHQGYKDDSRDIITDNRPPSFPKPVQNSHQAYETIQDHPTSVSHPSTHPINGNGEWILVSTTKGYQYPNNKRQRSVEVTPDSIGTRRGIRLTVLPPENDGNVNMTTSHGGMLEVESTFETVEESHNKHVESMNEQNPTKNKFPVHKKKPVKTVYTARPKPGVFNTPGRPTIVKQDNSNDATAVLAAVGAGMVPATMAMLLPFAGRKKRSVKNNLLPKVNITYVPTNLFKL